ncbi:MAG: prolyl oligopeptidase family serine peptidase [Hyphomonas sp.]|nr:prolyl oligopeptidase family serine peptidase [Hyphomonas sp.]
MTRAVLFLILVASLFGVRADAEPRPMSPVDMIEIPRLSDGALSPDGRYFAYLRSSTLWAENKIINELKIIDRASGALVDIPALSEADVSDSRVWWHPDSSGFVFLKTPEAAPSGDRKRQAYFYHLERDEQTQLTAHEEAILDVDWMPDGSGFYFVSAQQQPVSDRALLADGWVIPPFEANANREIWYFDLGDQAARSIVSGEFSIRQVSVSGNDAALTYSRVPDHRFDSVYRGDVFVNHRDDNQSVRWTANAHGEVEPQLSPDGRSLAYIATVNEDGEPFYEPKVFIKTADREPERLLPRMAMEALSFAWDRSGEGVFVLGNTGLRANLYHYHLTSETLRQLTDGDQSVASWSYDARTDTHIARIETAASPGEFQIMSDESEGFQPITSDYAHWPDTFLTPRQAQVSWRGRWGARIEGLLVYPIGYEEGKRYPLVTITHGGPQASARFGTWFASNYLPVLAGQGYMVLLPNHRGGTGYGDRFMRDMVGRYFRNAHHDVIDGIDALVDRGLADPDRLITMGWSAGGHMVNKLITHTDRFKVASSGAGASDWLSMHGESDSRFARQFIFGGTPWQRDAPRSRYAQDSPLRNVWRVTTPTVFFVGEDDRRVPPTQSILMYRGVRSTGTPTALYQASNEPHNFRKPANQLFKINTELSWYAGFALSQRFEPVLPNAAYQSPPDGLELTQAEGAREASSSP